MSTAPAVGLRMHLDLPQDTYAAGDDITGTLVVRNDTRTRVTFSVTHSHTDDGTLVAGSGWASSARNTTDAITTDQYTLEPGQHTGITVVVKTKACGEAMNTYDPLPAGHYQAMAELEWLTAGDYGTWWSPLVPVTLT